MECGGLTPLWMFGLRGAAGPSKKPKRRQAAALHRSKAAIQARKPDLPVPRWPNQMAKSDGQISLGHWRSLLAIWGRVNWPSRVYTFVNLRLKYDTEASACTWSGTVWLLSGSVVPIVKVKGPFGFIAAPSEEYSVTLL